MAEAGSLIDAAAPLRRLRKSVACRPLAVLRCDAMRLLVLAVLALIPRLATAQVWQDATASCLGTTAEWSSKLEIADVDGDGLPDILVANGGNYSSKGPAEPARVWKNLGNWATPNVSHCQEISAEAVGGFVGNSRMIKVADVNGDGRPDILTGGAYQTQLKLFLRTTTGWTDASAQLPQQLTSIGDAEFGDVDGDGDLDLVLAEWGSATPASGQGGRTRLYLNDGTGVFTEATTTNMPDQLVKWSWDLTLADVDNDFDLDILVSCKLCTQSYLFTNDGTGHFTNQPSALPHFTNNYALEPMDIDGDGFLDLATINDGAGGKDHLFHNNGDGTFADETTARLIFNPAEDDNAVVFLDVDSDGDADMLVASLSGADRLLLNDGTGHFTLSPITATPDDTPGSLGIQVADLDGDGRLDVVQSQGEVAFPEKVQLATSAVAVDTQPPVIRVEQISPGATEIRARVHDRKSPQHPSDFQRVWLVTNGSVETDLVWYGEYLWRASVPSGATSYHVCAKDRVGNQACSPDQSIVTTHEVTDVFPDGGATADAPLASTQPGGCCEAGGSAPSSLLLAMVVFGASARSRRTARRSRTAPRDLPSG